MQLDPRRVLTFSQVARHGSFSRAAVAMSLTQSAVSHQLRLLRSMRLVRSRRDGRHIYYAIDDDHITKLFKQGLDHVQEQGAAIGRLRLARRA